MKKEEALRKAANICSRQEKCISDIVKKLNDWELSEFDQDFIIETLIAEKFIDEERYVLAYVKDKFLFNKWGKIKISHALHLKAVPSRIIQYGLDELSDEDYQKVLHDLIVAKQKAIKSKDDFDKRAKLTRFALSRGFEMDLIQTEIDIIL